MSMVLMPALDMSLDIMSIIIESTSRSFHFTSWRRAAARIERYSSTVPRHRVPRTLSMNSHGRHMNRAGPARRSLERMPTNTAPPRSFRRAITAAAAALLLAAGGLLVASPASAHDELVSTDPAADTSLEALPAELTLTFSGELAADPGATELQVTDASGAVLADGDPLVEGTVVTRR